MSSPPVASGNEASGEDDEGLNGAGSSVARPPGTCRGRRRRPRASVRQKKIRGVAQSVVRPDLARYAGDGHDRQVGQEPLEVRLTGRVVLDRMMEAYRHDVRILVHAQVLTADLDGDHLGLLVGSRHVVEAPQDLESHRNGERAGEDARRNDDPRAEPGTPVLALRRPRAPTGADGHGARRGQHRGGHRAEGEREQGHASPHLVQRVGRGGDGEESEQRARRRRAPRHPTSGRSA